MPFLGKQPTAGFASIVKDDFTPNGSTTAFTLSKQVANVNDIAVFVGNVRQEPTDAYTVNGTTLTMSEAPASGLNFYVLHIAGTVESSVVPADNTISTAKIVSSAVTDAKIAGMAASKLTGALPALDGSALTGLSAVVRQVVHGSDTDGYSQTTSTSWSDAFSVNITPTASDSKFLIWFTGNIRSQRDGDQLLGLIRVGRTISGGSFVQLDASDSGYADNQSVRQHIRYISHPAAAAMSSDFAFMELDTPSTTSQITYQIQQQMQSSQAFQRIGGSSIIVMEIAP